MSDWKEELRNAGVDVDGTIARFSNKEERYIKYLKLFSEDTCFSELIDALTEGDASEAFEKCHMLKGLVNNLGFTRMIPDINEACEILRAGSMEGVMPLLDGVTDNYNDIINIINSLL